MYIYGYLPIALCIAAALIKLLVPQNLHTQDIAEKEKVFFAIPQFKHIMQASSMNGAHFEMIYI